MTYKHCGKCEHKQECAYDCIEFKPSVQTNEEWLRSCTTEQLAEWIADTINDTVDVMSIDSWAGDVDRDDYWQRKSDWVEWLKQPHTKE